ncbi:MAG: hypothetical protein AAGC53_11490 [Actinomycetota bacterium]
MTEPTRPSTPALAGGTNLDQLMPVVLFFVLYNVWDIIPAVLAATAWSIKAAIGRRRRGLAIGWWLPTVSIYLIVRAAITVAVDQDVIDFGVSSEAVYFGIGFATKFLIGIAVAVTIIIGRPVLAWAIPMVISLPRAVLDDPRYLRTMANASWIIVFYEVGSAIWDVWLYNNSGFNLFFLARSGSNFVFAFICITAGLMYIDRGLEPIEEYPGIAELLEGQGRPVS